MSRQIDEMLDAVIDDDETFTITKDGKPAAVILSDHHLTEMRSALAGHEIIDEGWRGQDWVVTCSCGDTQTALHSDIGFWQWLDHAKDESEAKAS